MQIIWSSWIQRIDDSKLILLLSCNIPTLFLRQINITILSGWVWDQQAHINWKQTSKCLDHAGFGASCSIMKRNWSNWSKNSLWANLFQKHNLSEANLSFSKKKKRWTHLKSPNWQNRRTCTNQDKLNIPGYIFWR